MEDSPGTTRQEVAEEPQGLLATKLHLPRTPPRFVPRQRLLDQLEQGLDRDLTLVSAPAGFGKTALLADWCREQSHPIAWLSVDDRDNDPVRFWRHLGYGLDGVRPGLFDRMAPLVDPPGPPSFDVPVSEVVNSLDSSDQELLLVVDDYHLIDDDVVHESMRFLLEHRPDCLHLVLASRTDPPLPLARLRAGDRLTEIGTVELRFDTGEAAEFLREAIGTDLSADIVAQLVARTEGWPVGLQLAGLLLVGQPDVAEFVESFSGSHRYVLDYLTEEVLEQQPEDLRTFMLETSVLERLSGPLCDAVTGRRDGQRMLETIESANLFLTPLDDVRGWWRYHQLFSDSLRSRLEKR